MYREYSLIRIASNKEGKRGAIDNISRWGQSFCRRRQKIRSGPTIQTHSRHDFSNEQKIADGCGAGNCQINGSQASRRHFLLHFIALRLKWRQEKGVEISSQIIKTNSLANDRCSPLISNCENYFRPKVRAIVCLRYNCSVLKYNYLRSLTARVSRECFL